MGSTENLEHEFHAELQELLAVARGMAEGDFHRTVNIRARGAVGELARYINQTLQNLQHLDPTVKDSSREIPKVAQHLAEIVKTTEDATNRVLEEAEHLIEEQTKVEQGFCRIMEALGDAASEAGAQCQPAFVEIKALHAQSQARAIDIMAAMEFQDLTSQKIQKLIVLVAEVEERLLQLLVMFRLDDQLARPASADPVIAACATSQGVLCDQDLVDQLLAGFQTGQS